MPLPRRCSNQARNLLVPDLVPPVTTQVAHVLARCYGGLGMFMKERVFAHASRVTSLRNFHDLLGALLSMVWGPRDGT